MELTSAFKDIEKNLASVNEELGFKNTSEDETSIYFKGEKGVDRLVHDKSTNILQFECAYEDKGDETEYNTISRSLFELDAIDDRDVKSTSNEIVDELERLFKVRKQVNLDKVKMPKSVSRTKAKNGLVSYDVDSLANRFGTLYPEFKDEIKKNVMQYGEFLPEDFFMNYGTPKVLDVIKNGTEAEHKKLFKCDADGDDDDRPRKQLACLQKDFGLIKHRADGAVRRADDLGGDAAFPA